MRNRGFTLVELLATITILAVIALITIPTISNVLKENKNKIYETQIKQIEIAAKVWGSDNLGILPNDTDSTLEMTIDDVEKGNVLDDYKKLIITLQTLQDGGYINDEIKNNKTGELISPNTKIVITKNDKKLDYEVIIDKNES